MAYIRKRLYEDGTEKYTLGFKDQHGRWRERVVTGRKKDAENAMRNILEEVAKGTFEQEKEDPTFSQFAERFLKGRKNQIKPSTYADYEQVIKTHLDPFFGRTRVASITPSKVQTFLDKMSGKKVTAATTGKVYRVLKVILRYAMTLELIDRDPTIAIRPPRVKREEMDHLNVEEVEALLDKAEGDIRDIVPVAVFAGLRQGEILALRWRDIDFKAGVIRVVRSYHAPHGFTDLKSSASRRAVPMLPRLASVLEERYMAKEEPGPDELIFPSAKGTPIDRHNLMARGFEPALEAAKLRKIRFHDLRHTYASLAIAAGMDPKALQKAMGHSSITVTMDTYAHLFPGSFDRALKRMEGMFSRDSKVVSINRRKG